ncbi:hypothetical protein NHX12_026560 [Muraenolepis orangiensis]|uniref:Uncharacterized protein n=1 Tax=Muraenolepis orangiensis TaxID=630683 RepID=A0A9Q0IQW9_9TELE|nr:hypothetical protein NHX12_026560 [Muraenolepis orangiensis]
MRIREEQDTIAEDRRGEEKMGKRGEGQRGGVGEGEARRGACRGEQWRKEEQKRRGDQSWVRFGGAKVAPPMAVPLCVSAAELLI